MAETLRAEVVTEIERVILRFPPTNDDRPNLEELFTFLDLTLLVDSTF
jgi:hypothetical protein